jgi:hypothetical protein
MIHRVQGKQKDRERGRKEIFLPGWGAILLPAILIMASILPVFQDGTSTDWNSCILYNIDYYLVKL